MHMILQINKLTNPASQHAINIVYILYQTYNKKKQISLLNLSRTPNLILNATINYILIRATVSTLKA